MRFRFFSNLGNASSIVIFIHGLRGKLDGTWGAFPKLIQEHTNYDVMEWSYPAYLIRHAPSIDSIGGLLLSRLRISCSEYKEIVLVGHSMGCLIIESAIILELRASRGRLSPISQIRRVVLYAPPHAGSVAATLIGRFPPFRGQQLSFLGAGNARLMGLQRDWVNRVYRPEDGFRQDESARIAMHIVSGRRDFLVPPSAAQFVYSDQCFREVDGTHTSVKSPTSVSDARFTWLTDVLLGTGWDKMEP